MKTLSRLISLSLCLIMIVSCVIAGTVSAEEQLYTDVKPKRWSYEDIKYVTEKGLMNGTGNGKFSPAETMTRAMVVTVLYRLQGEPEVSYKVTFTDVKNSKWYTNAVIWAAENGIVNGVGGGKFAPMETVTREQLATILMRYATAQYIITDDTADITGYADYSRISNFAKDAMAWANAVGLITGVTSKTLEPRGEATREQFAAILHRFNELIESGAFTYELVYNTPKLISTYTEKDYPLVTDADFYVAVDGDDTNPGTLDRPFATFERARDAVRELKETKTTGTIKVAFKAGEYGNLTVSLTEEDSGSAECPITYCAYGDGDVVFTNGESIKLEDFVKIDDAEKYLFPDSAADSIYKVELGDKFDISGISSASELINSEGRWYNARFPNMDGDTPIYAQYLTGTGDKSTCILLPMLAKRVNKYHTYEGMVIGGRLQQEWMTETFSVASYDSQTSVVTFKEELQYGVSTASPHWFGGYVGGVSEELDSEREYWIDYDNMILYAYKPSSDFVFTTKGTFIRSTADYLNFVHLDFRGANDCALRLKGEGLTVDGCDIFGIGGNEALYIYDGSKNCVIKNCELSYLSGTGIAIQDFSGTSLEMTGHLVTNNHIHHYAQIQRNCHGVHMQGECNGVTVSHNEIAYAPHFATNGGFYGNIVEYNYIHHVMLEASDGGAIYTGRSHTARNNLFRYNILADLPDTAFGIYLDDGISGQSVYGNIFYNTGCVGLLMSGGRDNYICDNVFIYTGTQSTAVWGWNKYGDMEEDSVLDSWIGRKESLDGLPRDNEELMAIWRERHPTLFTMHFDFNNSDDINFEPNPSYCTFENNYAIGNCTINIEEKVVRYGTVNGNLEFTLEENPIFVNPALGDYRIKEGADFHNIPFEQIGRY